MVGFGISVGVRFGVRFGPFSLQRSEQNLRPNMILVPHCAQYLIA
jgi:hypothetical protein